MINRASSLLSAIVKITYTKESLSKIELENGRAPFNHYLYFYSDDESEFESKMKSAWRPGATCEIFKCTYGSGISRKASKRHGVWESF